MSAFPYLALISTKIVDYQQLAITFTCIPLSSILGPILTGLLHKMLETRGGKDLKGNLFHYRFFGRQIWELQILFSVYISFGRFYSPTDSLFASPTEICSKAFY